MERTTMLQGNPSVAERDRAIRGMRTSIRTRLGARRLDRELAAGAHPEDSPALATRARHLTRPSQRAALAGAIERILDEADRPPVLSSRAPINRRAVLAVHGELAVLARELRSDAPCAPRGIVRCRLLLNDGASPLYGPHPEQELRVAVRHARASLHLERRA